MLKKNVRLQSIVRLIPVVGDVVVHSCSYSLEGVSHLYTAGNLAALLPPSLPGPLQVRVIAAGVLVRPT